MKNPRLLGFIIAIAAGIVLGLVYGWVLNPPEVSNTSLASLRADYKTDLVLMVAEAYAAEGDLNRAENILDDLSPAGPLGLTREALQNAQVMGYSESELSFLRELENGLMTVEEPGGE